MAACAAKTGDLKMAVPKKPVTVYKKNGNSMKVNSDMLPYIDELNLSKKNPKAKETKTQE